MKKEHWSLIATAFDKNEDMSAGERVACLGLGLIFDPINAVAKTLEAMGVDNPPANTDITDPTHPFNDYP